MSQADSEYLQTQPYMTTPILEYPAPPYETKPVPETEYRFGDYVISRPIGSRPEFLGRIIYAFKNGYGEQQYYVRDENGQVWLRTEQDFIVN